MSKLQSLPLFSLLILLSSSPGFLCTTFTITNNCAYTVWPGILSGAGTAPLDTTGFSLRSGESHPLQIPSSWSGRLWARTHCSTDPITGLFSCATGDCGSGKPECSGAGASPPATLAEFTLDGSSDMDFFDVSLVDGYNLPMLVSPSGGSGGNCTATGCVVDINDRCPSDLRVVLSDSGGQRVACRSACEAFEKPEFCCSGEYGNPNTCKPSSYSQIFKNACPRAYSYAFDDATSTFTCNTGVNYLITFCPSSSSQKALTNDPLATGVPLINDTMVFLGAVTSGAVPPAKPFSALVTVAGLAALWPVLRQGLLV
ncbi:thaumatin-like protein 1 [Phalaenopsis equestris]|uniref:thaumatin-like protein 1 n=1 Tax=Phalaenopsis equestris TaxID=78828 RepID=UPI0009E4EF2D|nr:thaumatin-like protein 1 [Phalaenopsis equestris]